MYDFNPEKQNISSIDETWVVEEHLIELFAELFRSHSLLEQKIKLLEGEVQLLRDKIDSLVR